MASFDYKSSLKLKEILNLSSKKATRKGDIPVRILKNSINAYLIELTLFINTCLIKGVVFADDLKLADIENGRSRKLSTC